MLETEPERALDGRANRTRDELGEVPDSSTLSFKGYRAPLSSLGLMASQDGGRKPRFGAKRTSRPCSPPSRARGQAPPAAMPSQAQRALACGSALFAALRAPAQSSERASEPRAPGSAAARGGGGGRPAHLHAGAPSQLKQAGGLLGRKSSGCARSPKRLAEAAQPLLGAGRPAPPPSG